MKDWKHHYEKAEQWLEMSEDPNRGYRAEQMIARAHVHATLASMEMEDGDFEEPPVATSSGPHVHITAQPEVKGWANPNYDVMGDLKQTLERFRQSPSTHATGTAMDMKWTEAKPIPDAAD